MPTATGPTLSDDDIDELLYLARTGETDELKRNIDALAISSSSTRSKVLAAAIDRNSHNGLLHMPSANGHLETVNELIRLADSHHAPLNLRNTAGNTPLHWAAINGHLEVVKTVVEAGADVTILNAAGQDACYAAELHGKEKIVEWLLKAASESATNEKASEADNESDCDSGRFPTTLEETTE